MTAHPSLSVVTARREAFGEAMRAGLSLADARDHAEQRAALVARAAPTPPAERMYRCAVARLATSIGLVRESELAECETCRGDGVLGDPLYEVDACPDCRGLGKVIGYGLGGRNCLPIPAEMMV